MILLSLVKKGNAVENVLLVDRIRANDGTKPQKLFHGDAANYRPLLANGNSVRM